MRNRFTQGTYIPKNTKKYIGTKKIRYLSSWELTFMRMCDSHPYIEQWASEPVKIPYIHPITGHKAMYVPDFLIQYRDKTGKVHKELIEIKPYNQTTNERANSKLEKAHAVINQAKWKAAMEWAKKYKLYFRIITENEIFITNKNKK